MSLGSKKIGIIVLALLVAVGVYFYIQGQSSNSSSSSSSSSSIMSDNNVASTNVFESGNQLELHKAGTLPDHILGNPDAKVTIVEYASFTCPFCARFHVDTLKKFKTNYVDTGKVRFIYRDFYLDDIARAGATLAQCAPSDQFFAINDLIYSNQNKWLRSNQPFPEMVKLLKLVGYSDEAVAECFENEKIVKGVIADRERAAREFGVNSTPTLFINGVKQGGGAIGYEQLAGIVDKLLESE